MEDIKSEAQKLLDQIVKAHLGKEEETPEGFYDVKGWMKLWGYSKSRTRSLLDLAVENKLVEVRKLKKILNGNIRHIKYFKKIQ